MAGSLNLFLSVAATVVVTALAFYNPIVPKGQDPSVKYFDNNYYLVQTISDAGVSVTRSERLEDLGTGVKTTVWSAPADSEYCCEVWAPELVYWDDERRWYIYFAADDGVQLNHRTYVLQGEVGAEPDGNYTFLGKIAPITDKWSIDSSVITMNGTRYFVWSGLENAGDNFQNIYIASMSDPVTFTSDRHMISTPSEAWEGTINEGPAPLQKEGRSYLAYSASGGDDYCLGLLTYNGGDPLDQGSWEKTTEGPVFAKNPDAGVYATGHNSFTLSPDDSETWNVYHGDDAPNAGWGDRSVRAQRLDWNEDGSPNFGQAVGFSESLDPPSGE